MIYHILLLLFHCSLSFALITMSLHLFYCVPVVLLKEHHCVRERFSSSFLLAVCLDAPKYFKYEMNAVFLTRILQQKPGRERRVRTGGDYRYFLI